MLQSGFLKAIQWGDSPKDLATIIRKRSGTIKTGENN